MNDTSFVMPRFCDNTTSVTIANRNSTIAEGMINYLKGDGGLLVEPKSSKATV